MEFRLQREAEGGNDPARTGAAGSASTCATNVGVEREKMTLDAIKNG